MLVREKVINHRRYQSSAIIHRYQSFVINRGPAVIFSVTDIVSRRIGAIPKSAAKPGSFELFRKDLQHHVWFYGRVDDACVSIGVGFGIGRR